MSIRPGCVARAVLLSYVGLTCRAQEGLRQWSESQVIEQFLAEGPQSRELRARVALVEAEERTRSVYPNPVLSYSREGAGDNGVFEASQILPVRGRGRYLRVAGGAAGVYAPARRVAGLWWEPC